MTGVDEGGLQRLEARLAALIAEGPGLDPERAGAYRRACARIRRHHGAWRAGMPALEGLFDDDAHRARALAGSLCTELEDVLVAWARLRAETGEADAPAREFVDRCADRWRAEVQAFAGACRWDEPGRRAFTELVDTLAARARDRGLAALRGGGPGRPAAPSSLALGLRRMARGPLLALRRFFRPEP